MAYSYLDPVRLLKPTRPTGQTPQNAKQPIRATHKETGGSTKRARSHEGRVAGHGAGADKGVVDGAAQNAAAEGAVVEGGVAHE